jgi:glycerate kinase
MDPTDASSTAAPCLHSDILAGKNGQPVLDEEELTNAPEPVAAAREQRSLTVLVAAAARAEAVAAAQVAAAIADGVLATFPSARVLQVPDLDTGTCFIEQMVALSDGWIDRISLPGPHGEMFLGKLGLCGPRDSLTAVIATEEVVALEPGADRLRDPTSASSRAIGQLIVSALDRGARSIIVGCGSSGTYDGGIGMAEALGIRFFDAQRAEIVEAGGLLRLAAIDMSHRDSRLDRVSIQAVVDPAHELLGPCSVAPIQAPGHGASPSQVLRLERGLARFAQVVREHLGIDVAAIPGSGAAGGLAAGLVAFAGAVVVSRSTFLDQCTALQSALASADMAIVADAAPDIAGGCVPPAALAGSGDACGWLDRKAAALGLPVIAVPLEQLFAGSDPSNHEGPGAALPFATSGGDASWVERYRGTRLHAAGADALRRALGGWQRPAASS